MSILRDPLWQGIGAIVAILALLFYIYVEKNKTSKLITVPLGALRHALGLLRKASTVILHFLSIVTNVLIWGLLLTFILIAPLYLYRELVQRQPLYLDSYLVDSRSMAYALVVVLWCLSLSTLRQRSIIEKLRGQVAYLNRVPGIRDLKNQYNIELLTLAKSAWGDLTSELITGHNDSPFALDLATCSVFDVQDETLIVGCPNKVTYRRMNPSPPHTSVDSSEYDEKIRDKRAIEEVVRERLQVMRISYQLENKTLPKA